MYLVVKMVPMIQVAPMIKVDFYYHFPEKEVHLQCYSKQFQKQLIVINYILITTHVYILI